MTATTKHETEVHVDPDVPQFRVTREFDAPAAKVFRAHVDPELFVRWNAPEGMTSTIDHWEPRTGGSWQLHGGGFTLYGSFHEVRNGELIVHTFEASEEPGSVALTTIRFDDLGDGRSRLTETTLMGSMAARDVFVAGAVEGGVAWTHERLDELLTTF